jgi:hypothetical protein
METTRKEGIRVAKATEFISPARKCGAKRRHSRRKQPLRIISHPRLPEHHHKLLLKTPLPMMFLLIANVRLHRRHQRRTNTKRPIPLLPFKPAPEPARRIGFQLLHNLSQSQRRRQPDKQMYVISSSPSSQNREPQIARNPNQVSVKLLLQLNRNPVEPSLRNVQSSPRAHATFRNTKPELNGIALQP